MKIKTVIAMLLLTVVVIAGCSSSSNDSGLKPEDVNPDNPIPADALKQAVTANPGAWKGKEVSVVGNYFTNSPTKDGNTGKLISVQVNLTDSNRNPSVACVSTKEMPQDYITQKENRVVRGKVSEVTSQGLVKLEPCECVK
jgi:hypothetical protein